MALRLEGRLKFCSICVQATTDPAVLAAASKCPYIQQVVVSHEGFCNCSGAFPHAKPAGGCHQRMIVTQSSAYHR